MIHRDNQPTLGQIINSPSFGRLSYDKQTWIVARDRANKKVLIGGLGCIGVGQMWIDEDGYQEAPGFNDAPELECKQTETFQNNISAEQNILKEKQKPT